MERLLCQKLKDFTNNASIIDKRAVKIQTVAMTKTRKINRECQVLQINERPEYSIIATTNPRKLYKQCQVT